MASRCWSRQVASRPTAPYGTRPRHHHRRRNLRPNRRKSGRRHLAFFRLRPYGLCAGRTPEGTIDPDDDGFYRNIVIIMHQGMDCPLAQSFSRVWSELRFERPLEKLPRGWWANPSYRDTWDDFGVVEVSPLAITRPRFCSPRAPSWWSRSGWTATFSGIAVCSARIRPAGAPTSNTDRP